MEPDFLSPTEVALVKPAERPAAWDGGLDEGGGPEWPRAQQAEAPPWELVT